MGENNIHPIKYVIIVILIFIVIGGLFLLPLILAKAQNQTSQNSKTSFSQGLAGNTICSTGLGGCEKLNQSQQTSGGSLLGIFGGSNDEARLDPVISVVNVPGQTAVYRIINGKKHSMPTEEIFNSYGFKLNVVQEISQKELDKYPLARLFMLEGENNEDKNIYYLTDGGMIRPILNDEIFYSYGNRKEDIITINKKEFNYYPRNQFIFIERPKLDRDIYQISGGIKRYLTPIAVERMSIKEYEVAPVNQIELDAYPEGEPVIF